MISTTASLKLDTKQLAFFLGNNPILSLAEIFSIITKPTIILITKEILIITTNQPLPPAQVFQDQLGGTIKIATITSKITNLNEANLRTILTPLTLTQRTKITISLHNHHQQQLLHKIHNMVHHIKKTLTTKHPFRLVGRKYQTPTLATIYQEIFRKGRWKNKSASDLNLIKTTNHWLLAETNSIQNIDQYVQRDYKKPIRDAKIGMLPPKLAQIMINLAQLPPHTAFIDPFCGTGTIITEGLLLGHQPSGSDINPAMITATRTNCHFFHPTFNPQNITIQDATTTNYDTTIIITEGYLGDPLLTANHKQIALICANVEQIYLKFFQAIAASTHKPAKIVLTLPFWSLANQELIFLKKALDFITGIGYNFACNSLDLALQSMVDMTIDTLGKQMKQRHSLLYKRPHQIVGREIIILHYNPR